jgi:hypothetical protein
MKSFVKISAGVIIVSLLTGGCNLFTQNNTANEYALQTAIASTVMALQTVSVVPSTATITAAPPATATPTSQVQPVFTATASTQPTATLVTATAAVNPAYLITDVEDITAPDNAVYQPGESFTKTWRLTNGGSAAWTSNFKLVYINGDQMGADTVSLDRAVAPEATIDVSVALTAPTTEGTYKGNFMLQTEDGKNFGVGSTGTSPFWVKIVVQKFFQVSDAVVNASPASFSGDCPGSINLAAAITSPSAGVVTYYLITSTGNSSTYTMTFNAAGTQTSTVIPWPVTASDPLTVHVYVNSPNHQDFPGITIPVKCN